MGNHCDYYKRAMDHCRLSGVSEDNYLQYLQPVQPVPAGGALVTPSSKASTEITFPSSPKDVMADNAECKRLIHIKRVKLSGADEILWRTK